MATINGKIYRELRCKTPGCEKLMGYQYVFAGRIAFTCPRCGELNELEFKHLKTKEVEDTIESEFTVTNENSEQMNLKGGE